MCAIECGGGLCSTGTAACKNTGCYDCTNLQLTEMASCTFPVTTQTLYAW